MSKIITVIQLLNRTANGEEVPKKVQYNEKEYFYHDYSKNYYYINDNEESLFDDTIAFRANNEVKILEDNTEEIEELDNWFVDERKECREFDIQAINLCFSKHRDKINELVKAVNSIRKDKNND